VSYKGYFKPLVKLTIEHSFFAGGLCKNLTFIPTSSTQEVMHHHQLLVKSSEYGLILLKDVEHSVLVNEPILLRFEVFSRDVYFSTYTEMTVEQDETLYYSTALCDLDQSVLVPAALPKSEMAAQHKGAKKNLSAPVFVVDIFLDADDFFSISESTDETEQHFFIKLSARALHWKYYFFGELASLDLDIHDLNNQFPERFELCAEPVAKNGKAYISQGLILLNEAPDQRFQLKDKNNSGKSLIKRLPNANVQLLGKGRNSSGQSVLVAEIYINQ
jgi:hypothetical protein